MLIPAEWKEGGLTHRSRKMIYAEDKNIVNLVDANILIHGIGNIDKEKQLDYLMRRFDIPYEEAEKQYSIQSGYSKRMCDSILKWRGYRTPGIPMITDFTLDEVIRNIGKDETKDFFAKIKDNRDALCGFASTPFTEGKKIRQGAVDFLPKKIKSIALRKYEDYVRSKDNDMCLYAVAYHISALSELKTGIITSDRNMRNFIEDMNNLIIPTGQKKIYAFGPGSFLRSVLREATDDIENSY